MYSTEYSTKIRYLMFKLRNLIVFTKIYTHSEFDAGNTFQKKLGLGHLYHFVTSPFS